MAKHSYVSFKTAWATLSPSDARRNTSLAPPATADRFSGDDKPSMPRPPANRPTSCCASASARRTAVLRADAYASTQPNCPHPQIRAPTWPGGVTIMWPPSTNPCDPVCTLPSKINPNPTPVPIVIMATFLAPGCVSKKSVPHTSAATAASASFSNTTGTAALSSNRARTLVAKLAL